MGMKIRAKPRQWLSSLSLLVALLGLCLLPSGSGPPALAATDVAPAGRAAASPALNGQAYLPALFQPALPARAIYLGVYLWPNYPIFPQQIAAFEAEVGKKHAIYHFYVDWVSDGSWSNAEGPLNDIIQHGSTPMLTWMSCDGSQCGTGCDASWDLEGINNGSHDTYIRSFAGSVAAWGHTLLLRWGHEMNLVGYPWTGYCNGANDAAPLAFIAAYQRIHNLFKQEGATNVQFIWSPNYQSYPDAAGDSWNDIDNYYPGDAYVDWIGVGGYNWGASSSNNNYKYLTFTDLFDGYLRSEAALHPTKPEMVADYSSVEDDGPGDKATWISQAFAAMPNYPNLSAEVWYDGLPTQSYFAITSTAASLVAYRGAIAAPIFSSQTPWN